VLPLDGVAGQSTVGAETVEVLGVEIQVHAGEEQVSLRQVGLPPMAILSFAGDDGMRRPKVELILSPEQERRVVRVEAFDAEFVIGVVLVGKMKSAAERAPGGDAAHGRTDGIKGEEVHAALLGVVVLKVLLPEACVVAGLFGGLPVLGVSSGGGEQDGELDEGEPAETVHDFTCRWASNAAFPTA
jgi:hypothetical protein